MARLRRAGARWRLLVHESRGTSHGVSDDPGKDREHYQHHHLPNTEFDELVVGRWLHIEQMNAKVWWMNISGVTIHVTVDRSGRPKQVTVHGPGDYADREDGVSYELAWSDQEGRQMPQVITTKASDYYHRMEDCAAFQAGRHGSEQAGYNLHPVLRLTEAEAQAKHKKPCSQCVTS